MNWSEQQQAFLDWCEKGSGSCVLVAVAGAGKTTVLIEGGRRIRGQVAYVAYNKDIVKETEEKLKKKGIDWKKMQAKTAHSFGWGAFKKARGWSNDEATNHIDKHKVDSILNGLMDDKHPLKAQQPGMVKLISLAKQSMFGMLKPIESYDAWEEMAEHYDVFDDDDQPIAIRDVIDMCILALKASKNDLDRVDYDDMIYMPLIHKMRFWRFQNVFIDESQDTNAARRALVRAMLMPNGRVAAVGDPHQGIYGFTGADADALQLIAKDFNCKWLNLTITYRCPKTVVTFAQRWVSHITAAETAPEGAVSATTMDDFFKRNDLGAGSAVLCRLNKPLVSLAFQLIRRRIPCRIEGRDIAESLQKLMRRWKVKTLNQLEAKIENYLEAEKTKLLAKKKEDKLAQVEDTVETIRVIIDQCRKEGKHSIDEAVEYVGELFGDRVTGMMVLSSIHKAKGREWENVFWLDRANTCPSPWARQAWQVEQENNLCYVAATRAKEQLVELAAPMVKR